MFLWCLLEVDQLSPTFLLVLLVKYLSLLLLLVVNDWDIGLQIKQNKMLCGFAMSSRLYLVCHFQTLEPFEPCGPFVWTTFCLLIFSTILFSDSKLLRNWNRNVWRMCLIPLVLQKGIKGISPSCSKGHRKTQIKRLLKSEFCQISYILQSLQFQLITIHDYSTCLGQTPPY